MYVIIPYSTEPGRSVISPTCSPVRLFQAFSTGGPFDPSVVKSRSPDTICTELPPPPKRDMSTPCSAGWLRISSSTSPIGSHQIRSPVFMSYADTRLYGGLNAGSPCTAGNPPPVPATHCEIVVPVVMMLSGSSCSRPGVTPPPLQPRDDGTYRMPVVGSSVAGFVMLSPP